jgi:hypothetical protein
MAAEQPFDAPVIVPPAVGSERATVRERLVPLSAWQVEDVHFEFDSSFVLPEAAEAFALLAAVRHDHPRSPISLFGHADPVGDDEYNKVLSGRRALAIYAVLTRRTDLWERLYSKPHGRDKWGPGAVGTMRGALGQPDDGTVPRTAAERATLFAAYMDLLCRDLAGQPFTLNASRDFLAGGADKEGKGDYQGCGEFNPEFLLSRDELAAFQQETPDAAGRRAGLDAANAPNRRVVALVYPPGATADPKAWPCPRALDGTAGCRKRLWSDAPTRRQPGPVRRTQAETQDVFACRFYDRQAPAIVSANRARLVRQELRMLDDGGEPMRQEAWTFRVSGIEVSDTTGDDGVIRVRVPSSASEAVLVIRGQEIPIEIAILPPPTSTLGVQYRLRNLGYYEGAVDGQPGPAVRDAILRFQQERQEDGASVPVNGEADEPTRAELVRYHGS